MNATIHKRPLRTKITLTRQECEAILEARESYISGMGFDAHPRVIANAIALDRVIAKLDRASDLHPLTGATS